MKFARRNDEPFRGHELVGSSLFHPADQEDAQAVRRATLVERWMRKYSGQLAISEFVLLEARNVFSRVSGKPRPLEWEHLKGDLGRRLTVEPFRWEPLREQTFKIFDRLSHKLNLGTFDATLLASVLLSGARPLLSFDQTLRRAASAYQIPVFPILSSAEMALLRSLKF